MATDSAKTKQVDCQIRTSLPMTSSPKTTTTKRLHISFQPSLPTHSSTADLQKSLRAQFSKFGNTVTAVDGFGPGALDGVGQPRRFGYVSVQGGEAGIAKCVNSLSGSTWKGVKVRVGDAKPDYAQRIAAENASPTPTRKRKRAAAGVHAPDMSLVTPENAATRAGWTVSAMGRVLRPMRMRPARPLPPPLDVGASAKATTTTKKTKMEQKEGKERKERKRRREPDVRAPRKTIDVTRWGSVQLKGVFLENAGAAKSKDDDHLEAKMDSVDEDGSSTSGDDDGDDDDEEEAEPASALKPVDSSPKHSADKPQTKPAPVVPPPKSAQAPITLQRQQLPENHAMDLVGEKNDTLRLLDSLFGGSGAKSWGGRESVGSDVDEEELLRVGGPKRDDDHEDEDGIEFVPMDVDGGGGEHDEDDGDSEEEEEEELPAAPIAAPAEPSKTTRIKDLFASRAEDTAGAGFSLLGHLDLELDDDTEFAHLSAVAEPAHTTAQAAQVFVSAPAAATTKVAVPIMLDPKQPLFFPLASSFALVGATNNTKAHQRDILDVTKDAGHSAHFYKTETDEEIRAKWEAEKVELTRDWTRRWKEAVKMQRRRGGARKGGGGDQ
ncbi:hypothetical protein HMN09_01108600 [Mycena chlorophos]|uniref:RRM domain-containing protein n=1 Tax=Mycena chlorophos TaxID=658473 RepID=A0A8H6SCV7_MYCCL|nr:hypothetical protein HMN09_01108600 [Mycena chlorophos]